MGSDIDGIIEVKIDGNWQYYSTIDFKRTRNYSLWCYLFGVRCDKDDEDNHGLFNSNHVSRNDCSLYMQNLFDEEEFDDIYGPYYITADEVEKIDFDFTHALIYKGVFSLLKDDLKPIYEDSRMIVWID